MRRWAQPRPVLRDVPTTVAQRERSMLALWDDGRSIEEIAEQLHIPQHLVEQSVDCFGARA